MTIHSSSLDEHHAESSSPSNSWRAKRSARSSPSHEDPPGPSGDGAPADGHVSRPARSGLSEEEARLTDEQKERYRTLKRKLQATKQRQAELLHEIRSRRLFREEYATYAGFCDGELGYTRRYADHLAFWGWTRGVLSPPPERESHARHLPSNASQETLTDLWTIVQERAGEGSVTASLVEDVVGEYRSEDPPGSEGDHDPSEEDEEEEEPDPDDSGSSSEKASENSGDDENDGSSDVDGPEKDSDDGDDFASGSKDRKTNGRPGRPGDGDDQDDSPDDDPDGVRPGGSGGAPYAPSMMIAIPGGVAIQHDLEDRVTARDEERDLCVPAETVTEAELEAVLDALSPDAAPPLFSTLVGADGLFSPLESPSGGRASLPGPDETLQAPTTLRLRTLAQIRRKVGRDRSCRILLSPGIDLFAPDVPQVGQTITLRACEGAESTVLLYTEHPERTTGLSFPDSVSLGAPASRTTLADVEGRLMASGASSCWVQYTAGPKDVQESAFPLSTGSPVDWLLCHGPGQLMTHEQYRGLVASAETAGTRLFFVDPLRIVHRTVPTDDTVG
jgi:hypothetical protein